jgi:hypothetical protein
MHAGPPSSPRPALAAHRWARAGSSIRSDRFARSRAQRPSPGRCRSESRSRYHAGPGPAPIRKPGNPGPISAHHPGAADRAGQRASDARPRLRVRRPRAASDENTGAEGAQAGKEGIEFALHAATTKAQQGRQQRGQRQFARARKGIRVIGAACQVSKGRAVQVIGAIGQDALCKITVLRQKSCQPQMKVKQNQ